MFFLGNKAFVIDFLETGLLCCVYWRPNGKELSGQNIFPSPEFRQAFYPSLSGVLLLSVNNCTSRLEYITRNVYRSRIYNIYLKYITMDVNLEYTIYLEYITWNIYLENITRSVVNGLIQ